MTNNVNDHETARKTLTRLQTAFNDAFGSHRRFPLDAHERLARGERVSIYSGTPEEWVAALHVENNREGTQSLLTYALDLTTKPLSPRMREQLHAAATRFEEAARRACSDGKP